jgi:spore coat polysaccharide biosynthesis protein SpsF
MLHSPDTPRTVAIVQARMSSTRLPGKVLLPLAGMPAIVFMLERVRRARSVHAVVLATSIDASDDALAETVAAAGYPVHRGPLHDVLARFAGAASAHQADTVVRLTGDCPLIDPSLIDRVVALLHADRLDYANNTETPSYPDGLDVEAMRADTLRMAAAQARLASEREHVTPWIRAHRGLRKGLQRCAIDLSALRWTVDHADDYAVVRALVDALPRVVPGMAALDADLFDCLRVLDRHPMLRDANVHGRNEGYARSLAAEAEQTQALTA